MAFNESTEPNPQRPMDFKLLLLMHLDRILKLHSSLVDLSNKRNPQEYLAGQTELYGDSVEDLSVLLKPYIDKEYANAIKTLKVDFDYVPRSDVAMQTHTTRKKAYYRNKLGFLMELMNRNNLLLEEFGEFEAV